MQNNAIIIDDEPDARENLNLLLGRFCKGIILQGEFSNLQDGVEFLKNTQVDLVFLDVEMPEYAGYEIGDFFESIDFEIIFVTAYDQFAIKAFELAAIDYLLKPIDIDRLKGAVERFEQKKNLEKTQVRLQKMNQILHTSRKPTLSIHHKGYKKLLEIDSIFAIAGQAAYSEIYTSDGKTYTVSKNIAEVERELNDFTMFFRCHKSWLVNINEVSSYSKSSYCAKLNNGVTVKLSRQKLKEFIMLLE